MAAQPVKNALLVVGIHVFFLATIKEDFEAISLSLPQEVQVTTWKKYKKKPSLQYGPMEKINLYQKDGKRKLWRKEIWVQSNSSVKHDGGFVMSGVCMDTIGTDTLAAIG